MFDFLKNSLIVKIILALITICFLFFGVNGWTSRVRNNYIVEIGRTKITDFDMKSYLQRNHQAQDDKSIQEAYKDLQKRAYLVEGARKMGMLVSSKRIREMISSEPAFYSYNGQFDAEKYHRFIDQTYHSEALFEDELRNNMMSQLMSFYLTKNHIISDFQLMQYLSIYETKKTWQTLIFPVERYLTKVSYTEAQLRQFYQEHIKAYHQEQAIRYEYLLLTPKWMMTKVPLQEQEVRNYFDNNHADSPKRMVSHIAFAFPDGAQTDEVTKASIFQQAFAILKEVKAAPENFEIFAGKYSQDKSTAQFGGSLGLLEKNGQYQKSLEEAAFNTPPGKIYPQLVVTDDGYHIIKVDAKIDGKDYAEDKPGITYLLRFNKAKSAMAELRDKLSEAAFRESKDLHKISRQELGSDIVKESEGWVNKQGAFLKGVPVEVIESLFDPLSLSNHINSDVINVGNNDWIVRVTAVRPVRTPPFNEIRDKVIADYKLQQATQMALNDAQTTLSQLQQSKILPLTWNTMQTLSVGQARNQLPPDEFNQFLLATPLTGPVYYLIKRTSPVIVAVLSQKLDPPSEDKIKFIFGKANESIGHKNEVAMLSYLYRKISRKMGSVQLGSY